jgi:hypothetical protein
LDNLEYHSILGNVMEPSEVSETLSSKGADQPLGLPATPEVPLTKRERHYEVLRVSTEKFSPEASEEVQASQMQMTSPASPLPPASAGDHSQVPFSFAGSDSSSEADSFVQQFLNKDFFESQTTGSALSGDASSVTAQASQGLEEQEEIANITEALKEDGVSGALNISTVSRSSSDVFLQCGTNGILLSGRWLLLAVTCGVVHGVFISGSCCEVAGNFSHPEHDLRIFELKRGIALPGDYYRLADISEYLYEGGANRVKKLDYPRR